MEKLLLGAARRDVTPALGCQLYGYNLSTFAEAVHDPLYVRALYFRQGETRFLMISVDVGNIGTAYSDELRKKAAAASGVPFEHIFLSAIHTHTAPNVAEAIGWGERDVVYSDTVLTPGLLDAVREACANAVPVRMGYGVGESRAGVNRREQTIENGIWFGQCRYGCFDPDMTVLAFRDDAGQNVATIVNYAAHATAIGAVPVISADWPGVMCRRLEEMGAGVTAFFNGAEGDVGPRLSNGRTTSGTHDQNGARYADEIGAVAAQDAAAIYRGIRVYREADLAVRAGTLCLPLGPRETPEEAKAGMAEFAGETVNVRGQMLHYHTAVAASYEREFTERAYDEIPQTVARIGDVYLAAFPYEVFAEIGMRIKDYFGRPLCVIGLTNGTRGYFPTEWELTRGGYEVLSFQTMNLQPFAPNADFALIRETLKNLQEL